MISGNYNYSSPKVQEGLERLLSELENTTYIDPLYTESWLRDFLDYVRRNQDYSPIDISNEKAFIEALNVVSCKKTVIEIDDCDGTRRQTTIVDCPFFRELDSISYFFFLRFFFLLISELPWKWSDQVQ